MLSKKHRVSVKDFPKKAEVLFRGDHVTLKRHTGENDSPKLGVVIGGGAVRSAVARNTLKRMAHNSFQEALPQLSSGTNLLVVVKGPIIKLTREVKDKLLEELEASKGKLI